LGGGDDVLDLSLNAGVSGVTLDGGAGTADVLRMIDSLAIAGQRAINFERLEIVYVSGSPVDVSAMTSAFHHVTVSGGGNPFLIGLDAVDTLVLKDAANFYALDFGGRSVVALQLTDSSGAGVNFASNGIIAPALATANITVTDGRATPTGGFMDAVTFQGNQLTTVTVGGNAGLILTAGSTALTTVDASGLTLGGFAWTAGSLGSAAIVKGSATGTNTPDFTAISQGVTYTGGTGADIIKVGVGASTIDVGIDNSVDKVLVTRQTTMTDFITINHLAAGDQVHLPGMGVGFPDPPLTAVVTATPGSLMNQIDGYAAYADGSSAAMFFIQVGGDTYIFEDRSIDASYNPGTDVLIKLTGVTLTSANYDAANALITI
jgi:S-layer protein